MQALAPPIRRAARLAVCLTCLGLSALLTGCTSLREYIHNGFKVGPNYTEPSALLANDWIDAADVRVRKPADDLSQWWTVFNDPVLNSLICSAYTQNITLREAGFRVLEARAQLAIAAGNLFPQSQTVSGTYTRAMASRQLPGARAGAERFNSTWAYGFNLSWELDFWGRFRRAVEAGSANLDASVANFDDVLVTLLGDVATAYAQVRTLEQRIKYAKQNIELQRDTVRIVEGKVKAGVRPELDLIQSRSTMETTEAAVPELEIQLRLARNRLCVLMGIPPVDLTPSLGVGPIPTAPVDVGVGIPADLLRRRPDVRRAERQAAAQSAAIGIAEADFYPRLSINGNIGYAAASFPSLFNGSAMTGLVGPSFNWSVLNYGRIVNNVRVQDARFQELIATYQQTVLNANEDAEDGLVTFLKAQERTKLQAAAVTDSEKAVKIALAEYNQGAIDLTRVTLLQQTLVLQQDTLAQSQGEIVAGLIQVYRALGGGWQIKCTGCQPGVATPSEQLPAPKPVTPPAGPTTPATPPAGPTTAQMPALKPASPYGAVR